MAEMVSSMVVQETVSQILSGLLHRYGCKENSKLNHENLERLEMAYIKLEAAVETSYKWQITDASLLRWRKKLQLAAQECNHALHKCKQRILEDQHMEQEVRNSSFPRRTAHATKSFIFSAFSRNNYEASGSIVRRFEWFADGASEFLRFIELGGTPRRHMPVDSFTKQLFAGKELQHKIVRGNEYPFFLLWLVPFSTEDHGIEACLVFVQKNSNTPEDDFFFSVMLQLSESTDIVGIVVKCLQLFPPHFQPTVETIRKEITQLPTQDFSWVQYVDLWHRKHWDSLHSFSTQWFRPDPLCCKQHDEHKLSRGSQDMAGLQDVSLLDSVIEVNLQCQTLLYNKQQTSLSGGKDSPNLKGGLLFTPHGSSEYMLPPDKNCAMMVIYGEEQHCQHAGINLSQLKEIMLPKAIDYLHQNTEMEVCQVLWKSKHGTAYIQVGKASKETEAARRTFKGTRKRKLVQREDQEMGRRTLTISHFLDLWSAHAPIRLQGLIMDWIQKEKESQLAEPSLHLQL